MTETTALGAAMAAGSAEGINVWSLDSLEQEAITCDNFSPAITESGSLILILLQMWFTDGWIGIFFTPPRPQCALCPMERCCYENSWLGNDP